MSNWWALTLGRPRHSETPFVVTCPKTRDSDLVSSPDCLHGPRRPIYYIIDIV
jgi:hypothetical protein